MHQLPSGPEQLVIQGDFEAFSPQELYDYWVTPSLLTQWWPEKAVTSACTGGSYEFSWPSMDWCLKGVYEEVMPGRRLVFSWKWNHDPEDEPALKVAVDFAPADQNGTLLTITQGPYGDSCEDQEARKGHMEGWIHFCMRLAGLREGTQDSSMEGE